MLLGYLEFIALLFLPGLAVVEVFNLGPELSLAERLGLAFGLSMAVDVLVLAVKTTLGRGIDTTTLGALLAVSLVAFVVPVALRRKAASFATLSRYDLYVLGLVVAQAVLVAVHFYKYPVFPQFQSVDFTQHVQITTDLQAGNISFLPGGVLYYGAHLLMGSLVALSGDLVLLATQYAMGILVALSPLLVFFAVDSITGSKRVGLVAAILYVFTGFVWFGSVFDAGLYANFYGILSILLLFALVPMVLKQPRSPGVWVALVLAVASGYMSHYSFVTVIPALVALPVALLLVERKVNLPSVAVAAVVLVPAAVAAAVMPGLVTLLLQFAQSSGGGNLPGDTSISGLFAGWPVLRYAVIEIADDSGALLALALAVAGAYLGIRSKNPVVWMLLVWLVALLAVAPFTEGAWRFSYMTLLPLLVFASIAFEALIPRPEERAMKQRSKLRYRTDWTRARYAAVGIIFLLLVVNSWSWQLLGDAASNGAANNQTQHGILDAMGWMNANTPQGSLVVSVTSDYFNFYQLLYNRPSGYAPLAAPSDVVAASGNSTSPTYVVLTRVGTVVLANASQNPFSLYPNDSRFQMVYNQSGVAIFKLKP